MGKVFLLGQKNMSELYTCANDLLTMQCDIVNKLEEKIKQIKKHRRACNISNTVGASAGVIGTIALFYAPFADELSMIVAGGAIGAMVLGASTTITTSIVDRAKSKGFIKEVDELVKTQETDAKKLQSLLRNVESVVMKVKDEMRCTEEEALAVFLRASYCSGKGLLTTIASVQGAKAIKFAKDLVALKKMGCSVGLSLETKIPLGVSAETIAAMGRVSADIGTQALTTPELTRLMSNTLAVVGNVFDIAFVIYGWATKHPTLKSIEEMCKELKESISQLEQLLEYVRMFEK